MTCPSCNKEAQTHWQVWEHEDNGPPKWFQYTDCCGSRVGEVYNGYSPPGGGAEVVPRIGL